MNFFMFLLQLLLVTFLTQTLLVLTFITVAITITIILIMFSLIKSKDDKSPDMELLVEEENFREDRCPVAPEGRWLREHRLNRLSLSLEMS